METAASEKFVHVVQGDFSTSNDPNVVLTTVLGSCVAACIWDPIAQVGGLNHFLLPDRTKDAGNPIVYGAQAMELLINDLLKKGAIKRRLRAKLFGGGNVLEGLSNIGEKNAEFALNFLQNEGIDCVSSSLLGSQARRVRFYPTTGRASQKLIGQAVIEKPAPVVNEPKPDVELF